MSVRAAYERAIALHRAGKHGAAEDLYRQIIAQRPGHAGALHHLGVLASQKGRHAEAEKLIRESLAADPSDTDAWSNLGVVQRARGQLAEARAALEQAWRLAPGNANTRKNLAVVLRQIAHSLTEQRQFDRLLPILEQAHTLEPENVETLNRLAVQLLRLPGRLADSIGHLEKAWALAPGEATIGSNYAVALKRAGRLAEAARVLRRVLDLAPRDLAALTNLGDILSGLERHEEAVEILRRAIEQSPTCAEAQNNLGLALGQLEQTEEAVKHLELALAANPAYAPAHHNLGNQLIARGQIDEGVEHLRKTLALDPECVAAWYGLAFTGRHRFSPEELERMEALLARPGLSATDQSSMHFALAHAFDKSGPPERAFHHAARANALRRAADTRRGIRYDRTQQAALVDALIETFTPEFFEVHRGAGIADALPVFVTGMPRSGTTLVEQILASHPQVYAAGELNDVSRIAFGLGDYPRDLESLAPERLRELAAAHLARLRALGGGALRVVDKMTINFLHLGFLALLFPEARFIHLRRDPRDVAISCFFHNFSAPGLQFAFDLGDIAHFQQQHERIMVHWRSVLPLPIHEVQYEDLVNEPELRARALVAFCGLGWDERCLAFHRTERRVKTASALQVREPIYKRAVARWKRYEKELDALTADDSRPSTAAEWKAEALAHAREGRWSEALASFDCALALAPDDAVTHNNRGVVLGELGRLEAAIAAYREAIRLRPGLAKAHCDLGIAYYRLNRMPEARAAYDEALRHDPAHADALHNRGLLRTDLGELEGGAADLARALELKPGNPESWNMLGATLQVLGRVDEAMAHYDRAIALAPEHPMAHYNRACARLLRGDFEQGWPEHEWRLKRPEFRNLHLEAPRWDGSPVGTLLLLAEQGLGDTLQFVRYARLARERAQRLVVAIQPALMELLRGVDGVDELVAKEGPLPTFNAYAPLLSLAHLLREIPAPESYLRADPARVEHWRQRLEPGGIRVGLNWQGNPAFKRDSLRSLQLRAFAPLAAVPGVTLHSLHLGTGESQVADCGFPIVPLSREFDGSLGTFVDTAAAMCALDLVITSDTSLAHLAGALGVPVWVVLSSSPDWRWRDRGERSEWYPTMRLFRQRKLRDWSDPIEAIAASLRELASRP